MDPYRTSQQVGTCPRCRNPTESDGELDRMVCIAGCGEWYTRARLKDALSWDDINNDRHLVVTPWPWSPAACPVCQREMKVGFRAEVRFDYCGEHGLWLDSGEIQRFAQAFKLS